jgi:hypothetical protein
MPTIFDQPRWQRQMVYNVAGNLECIECIVDATPRIAITADSPDGIDFNGIRRTSVVPN